jgi:hypothetical protein
MPANITILVTKATSPRMIFVIRRIGQINGVSTFRENSFIRYNYPQ